MARSEAFQPCAACGKAPEVLAVVSIEETVQAFSSLGELNVPPYLKSERFNAAVYS